MKFNTIEEAIEDIRQGKMIVMVDDEDRENEGDLLMAAELATPESINFMASYGRGLICVPMTKERIQALNLDPMVSQNTDPHGTAFTVTVDASDSTTGISAFERAHTVQVLMNPTSVPDDLHRPGHIFPLQAREGGVLVRAGHTEGAVDLALHGGLVGVLVGGDRVADAAARSAEGGGEPAAGADRHLHRLDSGHVLEGGRGAQRGVLLRFQALAHRYLLSNAEGVLAAVAEEVGLHQGQEGT